MSSLGAIYNPESANWQNLPLEHTREARAIPECFLIQSRPGKERNALVRLESYGIESYLPILNKRRAGGRGDHCALFPSYLFSFFEAAQIPDINHLLSLCEGTWGIGRVVFFGSQAAKVAPEIVEAIKQREDAHGIIDLSNERKHEAFERGDQVKIVSGTFEGMAGVFDKQLNGQDRIRILLSNISFNHQGGWHAQSKFGGRQTSVTGSYQSICLSKFDVVRA